MGLYVTSATVKGKRGTLLVEDRHIVRARHKIVSAIEKGIVDDADLADLYRSRYGLWSYGGKKIGFHLFFKEY